VRAPRPIVFAVALAILPLAGCVDDAEPAAAIAPTNTTDDGQDTTLPDGRDFAAAKETNKTEAGVGGKLHIHDYWRGQTQVTIYDQKLNADLTPVFPDREDTGHVLVAFVNLENVPGENDRPALVYEGTGLVTFTVVEAPAWSQNLRVTFRTAGTDWSEPQALTAGAPFTYQPGLLEADMPHSTRSLWNWKLVSDAPAPVAGAPDATGGTPLEGSQADSAFRITIVVDKADEVKDWPGHPAFYADAPYRVVAENKPGKTTVQTVGDIYLYGVEADSVLPDKLISMGTDTLDIFVNITRIDSPVPPSGFFLFWKAADTRPNDLWNGDFNNDTDEKSYAHWHLKLDPEMLDAPYQPTSRFEFKVLMNPGNDDAVGCYRCIPYNIEYTLTVVARPDPEAAPVVIMDE